MTRYSKEEKLTHLELWKESGLSKLAYCKEADLHYKTFLSWAEVVLIGTSPLLIFINGDEPLIY